VCVFIRGNPPKMWVSISLLTLVIGRSAYASSQCGVDWPDTTTNCHMLCSAVLCGCASVVELGVRQGFDHFTGVPTTSDALSHSFGVPTTSACVISFLRRANNQCMRYLIPSACSRLSGLQAMSTLRSRQRVPPVMLLGVVLKLCLVEVAAFEGDADPTRIASFATEASGVSRVRA
jgi:hypothetical protein